MLFVREKVGTGGPSAQLNVGRIGGDPGHVDEDAQRGAVQRLFRAMVSHARARCTPGSRQHATRAESPGWRNPLLRSKCALRLRRALLNPWSGEESRQTDGRRPTWERSQPPARDALTRDLPETS